MKLERNQITYDSNWASVRICLLFGSDEAVGNKLDLSPDLNLFTSYGLATDTMLNGVWVARLK